MLLWLRNQYLHSSASMDGVGMEPLIKNESNSDYDAYLKKKEGPSSTSGIQSQKKEFKLADPSLTKNDVIAKPKEMEFKKINTHNDTTHSTIWKRVIIDG